MQLIIYLQFPGDYLYLCYVCNKKYATKGKLDFHMKTHQEAQYECTLCSKRFSTQQYLNNHMKVHPDQVCVLTRCSIIAVHIKTYIWSHKYCNFPMFNQE